jgi:hypothetical protein
LRIKNASSEIVGVRVCPELVGLFVGNKVGYIGSKVGDFV